MLKNGEYITLAIITDIHIRHDEDIISTNVYRAGTSKMKYFRDYVNNNKEIDYVLCLGDMGDRHRNDLDLFMTVWNTITKPKALTIGNHDLYDYSYAEVVSATGYNGKIANGGSVFNQSIKIDNTRVIMIDSTGHIGANEGYFSSETRQWITQECNLAEENTIILASHHSPHWHSRNNVDGFNEYNEMIGNIRKTYPHKSFWHITGHEHNFNDARIYHAQNEKITNIAMSVLLDDIPGTVNLMRVYSNGEIETGRISVDYPYSI